MSPAFIPDFSAGLSGIVATKAPCGLSNPKLSKSEVTACILTPSQPLTVFP